MASEAKVEEKLNRIIDLLQHLLALELARGGVSQTEIGKHLKTAKSSVGKMLRNFDTEYGNARR